MSQIHSPSRIKIEDYSPIQKRQPVSMSVNLNRKNSEEMYSRYRQSPTRSSQNSLPPKGPFLEFQKIVTSPAKKPSTPNKPLQLKQLLQNAQLAECLRTDDQTLSQINRSQEQSNRTCSKDKENLAFKQIRFNRQKTAGDCCGIEVIRQSYESQIEELKQTIQQLCSEMQYRSEHECTQKFDSLCQRDIDEIEHLREKLAETDLLYRRSQEEAKHWERLYNEIKQQVNQLEKYNSHDQVRQLKAEIERLRGRDSQKFQDLFQVQIKNYKSQITELEQKLKKHITEKEALKIEINNQQTEIQQYASKISHVEQLESLIEACQNDQDGFIKSLENKESEIQFLKGRVSKMGEQESRMRTEVHKFQQQVQTLQMERSQQENRITQLLAKEVDRESLKNDVEMLESQKRLLLDEYESLLEQSKRLSGMNETLKEQYQQMQSTHYDLEGQFQKQQTVIQQLDEELDSVKAQLQKANEDLTFSSAEHQAQFVELDAWFKNQVHLVVEPILKEKSDLEQKLSQFEIQNQKLFQECEKLFNDKDALTQELENVGQHHQSQYQEEIALLQEQRQQLTNQIEEMHKLSENLIYDKEQLEKQLSQIIDQLRTLEHHQSNLISQNQQLVNQQTLFVEKEISINESMANMVSEMDILKRELADYKDQVLEKETEIIRTNSLQQSQEFMIKQLQENNNNLKNELNQLYALIKKRKEDQEHLQASCDSKTKELQARLKELSEVTAQNRSLQERVTQLDDQRLKEELKKQVINILIQDLKKQNV